MRIPSSGAVALVLSLLAAGHAQAVDLPAPVVDGVAFTNFTPPDKIPHLIDFGSIHSDLGDASAALAIGGTPAPLIDAQTSDGTAGGSSARASGQLAYKVVLVGPQATVPIVVTASGGGSGKGTTSDGVFSVTARWSFFFDSSAPLAGDQISSGQINGGKFSKSFHGEHEVSLIANLAYTVEMSADSFSASVQDGATAVARAFVDPVFALGLGVDPELYHFEFSPGIGNTPAVPEPPAAAMALLGGALLLSLTKRRREGRRCP